MDNDFLEYLFVTGQLDDDLGLKEEDEEDEKEKDDDIQYVKKKDKRDIKK